MKSLVALSVFAFVASPALAQTAAPDRAGGPASALIGNHIEVSYGGSVAMRSSFAADGTYRLTSDGSTVTGDWLADERLLCWVQRQPRAEPGLGSRCEANMTAGKSVGDSWTQVDSMGETATVTLRAGPHP